MRYLFVRCTTPSEKPVACGFCGKNLGKEYVRDLQTRVIYHSFWCMELHIHQTLVRLGGHDAEISA